MMIGRQSRRQIHSVAGLGLCLVLALFLGPNCKCSPEDVTVEADCPGGKNAASSISIQFNLAGINDVGVDKQVRISGNRLPGQHNCFADGSVPAINPAVQLNGQGSGTQSVPNLQDGNWEVRVQVLGGASTPHPPQNVTGLLSPGAARNLVITNGPGGSLQVTF